MLSHTEKRESYIFQEVSIMLVSCHFDWHDPCRPY